MHDMQTNYLGHIAFIEMATHCVPHHQAQFRQRIRLSKNGITNPPCGVTAFGRLLRKK